MDDHDRDLILEKTWVEAAKMDRAAFKPLYNKYYDALFRFFLRRTDDEELSYELCSETFYKALSNLNNYEWRGVPFGGWLFKIGANELKRHFRNRKPIMVIEEEMLSCLEIEDERQKDYLPGLIGVLDQLKEDDLRLLELKYFEGLNFKEISGLLEIGESAAKMRVYRLLSKMKSLIPHHDQT